MSSPTSSMSYDSDDFMKKNFSNEMIQQFQQAWPRDLFRNITDEEQIMRQIDLNLSGKLSSISSENRFSKVERVDRGLLVGNQS